MTWPTKKLGELISFEKGKKMAITSTGEPYIGIDGLKTNQYAVYTQETKGVRCKSDDVLLVWDGAHAGTVGTGLTGFVGSTIVRVLHDNSLENKFLFYLLKFFQEKIRAAAQGAAIPHLSKVFINNIKIPLPPLEIQKQIVERLDKIAEAQKLNNELIQKSDELFQSLLHKELNPASKDWGVKKIKDVATVGNGGTPSTKNQKYWNGKILWLTPKELSGFEDMEIFDTERKISNEGLDHSSATLMPVGTVLFTSRAPIGYITIAGVPMATNQGFKNFVCDSKQLNNKFLYFFLRLKKKYLQSLGRGATFTEISKTIIEKVEIPLPSLKTQKQIIEKLSAVQDYKKQLFEQKTKLKELFDSALAKSFEVGYDDLNK